MLFLKRLAILAALPILLQAQSVCVPVPTPGTVINQPNLDEVEKRGVLAPGLSAFASLEAFAVAFGGSLPYVPASANAQKFWADFTPGSGEYVTVDGWLDTSDPATWSEFSMTVYGATAARFYRDRALAKDPVFAQIPRFRRFTATQPGELNMTSGIGRPGPRTVTAEEVPYPIARYRDDPTGENGKSWSYAQNHILRRNPVTGRVEACNYQDYDRAYPIVTTLSVGGSAGSIRVRAGMSPEAFLASVASALFGAGAPGERTAKIITLLEVQ